MIYFRKIYITLKPENEGMVKNAIIVFGKRPVLYGRKEPPITSVFFYSEVIPIVLQYQYILRIDLWFVIFDFNWMGKVKGERDYPLPDDYSRLNHYSKQNGQR